jgi:hypothetical protein
MGVQLREHKIGVVSLTLSPALVAANTTAEQTFACPGLVKTDFVSVVKPSAQAGLGIVGIRCSAPDVVAITFINATIGALTPTAAEAYLVKWMRAEQNDAIVKA